MDGQELEVLSLRSSSMLESSTLGSIDCALHPVSRELERGLNEHPVEVWPPCRLPMAGDQIYRHLLAKHLLKQPTDPSEKGKAVGVLAVERGHEGIDVDRRWVWPP